MVEIKEIVERILEEQFFKHFVGEQVTINVEKLSLGNVRLEFSKEKVLGKLGPRENQII